jgi:uncharacterized protein with PQ loop repeat
MATHQPDGRAVESSSGVAPSSGLERTLRVLSVATMAMTLPQVYGVWFSAPPSGVSAWSWGTYLLSACLWFYYGVRKKDKTIYVACIGWIVLDAAIVAGVVLRG